jgi:leader peptidase (prepilin peptidase)/N-methyltransferase
MYPVVELTTGLLFVWAYVDFGLSQATAKWLFFTCLVLILTVTDLRVRMLPDVVNWPGVAAGLAFSSVVPPADYTAFVLSFRLFHRPLPFRALGLLDGILGALFGSLLLWGLAAAYRLVRGREGMGMGDVKMMAMAGAFLGLRATFLVILLGSLLGSFVGLGTVLALYAAGWKSDLAERASRRGLGTVRSLRWLLASQSQLPLGTFLGVAALVVVYVSPWAAAHWEWIPRII